MRQALARVSLLATVVIVAAAAHAKTYPEPSIYPIKWQLDFKHSAAKRIAVGGAAYWYITYTVTNNTGQEQIWRPEFEMMTADGKMIKSDHEIPLEVFDRIKASEGSRFLLPASIIAGSLRQGEDQAKDGVAIWKEPSARMGSFEVFVGGLSGEFVILKDDDGKEVKTADGQTVILRKTLALDYAVYGGEQHPEQHEVHDLGEKWVMR